jgi:hypothetical protein
MARKEKTIHYLYKTTCIITGRWYIGMHSTNNLDDGYMGSGKRLRYSIRKYGVDNHEKEILEFFENRKELAIRETEIVNSDLVKEVNCMNLVVGGGGFMLDDYHYKCSKAGGNIHAEKIKNDLVYRGERLNKLKDSVKKGHKNGKYKYNNFSGKQHSAETKKKMSESSKGVGIGKSNSQYGTCWITKDETNKKIKKEDLDSYLNEGWVKGRKY